MPGRGSRQLAEGQSHHLESLPTPSASEAQNLNYSFPGRKQIRYVFPEEQWLFRVLWGRRQWGAAAGLQPS